MIDGRPLSNTVGTVLDPIFALRRRVRIAPGATARVAFWTMARGPAAALLDQIDKHRDAAAFERATTLAWTQAQVQLHHLGINPGEAGLFNASQAMCIYAGRDLAALVRDIRQGAGRNPVCGRRASPAICRSSCCESPTSRVSVSPASAAGSRILADEAARRRSRDPERAQSSYVQDLQIAHRNDGARQPVAAAVGTIDALGRVFVLRADLMPAETRALLVSVARVVLVAQRGSLSDQLDRIADADRTDASRQDARTRALQPSRAAAIHGARVLQRPGRLRAMDGKEYVTVLGPGQSTPAPWINVIANPSFGFQVAAEGSGYTWSANSRENQLTPWSNDPVTDRARRGILSARR